MQELLAQTQSSRSYITYLEQIYQQRSEMHQQAIEDCRLQEQQAKKLRLSRLDSQVQQWIEKDIDRITARAMKKLNLLPQEHANEVGALQTDAIQVLVGITDRTSPSKLIEDGASLDSGITKVSNLGMEQDLRSEPRYDGKGRRYRVYEFLAIFLCENFISYYKCYFNFVRNQPVNEEYCEYLYDSIVSTKVQEVSSASEKQKNVSSKRLVIATKDGKAICFRIDKFRILRGLSIKISQIDDAAIEIRRMLRQRRIDVIKIENTDD